MNQKFSTVKALIVIDMKNHTLNRPKISNKNTKNPVFQKNNAADILISKTEITVNGNPSEKTQVKNPRLDKIGARKIPFEKKAVARWPADSEI